MRFIKVLVILAALTAVAAVPRAWSADAPAKESPDPFCTALSKLLEGTGDGFVAARGDKVKDADNTWTAKVIVPGGKTCLVFAGPPASYTCTLYAAANEDEATFTFEDTTTRLVKCLPKGWTAKKQNDGIHTETIYTNATTPASLRLLRRIDSADGYFVELWLEAGKP